MNTQNAIEVCEDIGAVLGAVGQLEHRAGQGKVRKLLLKNLKFVKLGRVLALNGVGPNVIRSPEHLHIQVA